MRRLGVLLARLFVKLRWLVVLAWVGGAVWAALALPSISGAGNGSISALVPHNAPALTAQRISAHRFAFPFLTGTMVVVRNPHGLGAGREAQLVSLADRLSTHRVAGFGQIAGVLPLLNTLAPAPFGRARGTTALLYLYFQPNTSIYARVRVARRLVAEQVGRRPGEYVGVTGEVAAQASQTNVINANLKWVELATILLVALAIGLHFRAVGAGAVTIVAVGIAYVFADRMAAQLGKLGGVNVPTNVQPLLVVLVFGIVTDYSVFFISRFRALLREGVERRVAAERVVRQIVPLVVVAGITIAAGTAGLLVAHLGFLRAFGPGLAIAVLVAMIVAVTFVPAALAVGGSRLFWPRRIVPEAVAPAGAGAVAPAGAGAVAPAGAGAVAEAASGGGSPAPPAGVRRLAATRLAARHPVLASLLAGAIVLGAASGLLRIALGNEVIVALPPGSGIARAYDQASRGFAPGVLGPAVVVVTGPAIGYDRAALGRLQVLLAHQPGAAFVFGPRQQPLDKHLGVTISRSGDAARYAVFLKVDPVGARAITDVSRLTARLPALLKRAGLPASSYAVVAGDSALSADTVTATLQDLARVGPTVLAIIFVVMAVFLRALVAPLYLVATSALAALAALGLTVYVMQILLGYGEIAYYVVFIVAVLLVSLGSDYNVFLVGRIWQEGRRRPLREAVVLAGSRAARPITTAGAVLAASFALLALVPLRPFREIAFAMAAGLVIDAFVIRTILVPALITMVGTRSAWPGHGLRRSEEPAPVPADAGPALRGTPPSPERDAA